MNSSISFKERIQKNFKENKVLLFVFIAIWVVALVFLTNNYKNTLGKESYGPKELTEVVEVDSNTKISQLLSVDGDTETLSLKFATYARNNKGNLKLKVTGKNSKHVYLDESLNVKSITDNAYATYSFDEPLTSKKDKNILVEISSDSETGSAVGVYFSVTPFFENSELQINGENNIMELGVKFLLENENYEIFYKIALYSTIVVLSLLVLVLLLINPKQEIMFVILTAVFGLTLMMVISPGAAPDELLHYEQTLQVSNVMMFEDPSAIDKAYLNYDSYGDHVNVSYSYNRFIRDFNKPLKLKEELEGFTYEINGGYVGYYIPQAIGVTIARLLKVNTLKTFYAGRFTNLIFYLACLYIALKNTPTKKMLLGVIADLPIFVQQASSYSYDAFINALILILISFLFKWMYIEEKVTRKDYILVFISCMLLAPAKVIYGVFIFLFWFVPVTRFNNKKSKIIMISILCLPTVAFVGYNAFIRTIGTLSDTKYSANLILADPSEAVGYIGPDDHNLFNITFILKHPDLTIQIIYRTVRFYLSTWFYQSIGRSLAGSNLVMPMALIRIILVCIVIASLREEKYNLSGKMRIAFVVACLMIAMLILAMMLTGWTKRKDYLIKGVQGRYFCPLLPYFFSIFSNKKFKLPAKLDKYVLYTLILVNFETIIYVLSYTFVN